MKPFAIWLVVCVLFFGGLAVFTHLSLTANPTRIVIAFDDSFYMKDAWPKIASRLEPVLGRRYTEYFVISNKEKISKEWEKEHVVERFLQTRIFMGEYDLSDLVNTTKYPELKQADKIIVFTSGKDTAVIRQNNKVEVISL